MADEEKMRLRREKAAAWKAQQQQKEGEDAVRKLEEHTASLAAAEEVSRTQGIVWQKATPDLPGDTKDSRGSLADSSRQPAGGDEGGWQSWAKQTGGGGRRGGAGDDGGGGAGGAGRAGPSGWKQTVGGLGTISEKYGGHNNITSMMEERERQLLEGDGDYSMDINSRPDQSIDTSRCEIATMETPISSGNLGYQMLQRMGWKGHGTGLGREGRGIYDPIPITTKDMLDLSSRVGVGRAEEETEKHQAATEQRALESLVQANESEERRQAREEGVLKQALITQEVGEILRPFYCEVCDKQYTNDGQFQEHLNSYDHHHKKRFADFQKEAKAMKRGPTKDERQRKEARRMEREMAARAAAAAAAASSAPPPPPPDDPPPPPPDAPPPLPAGAPPVKMTFGIKPKAGGTGGLGAKKAAAPKRPAAMAFGDDSD